jgi:hypothetical protein
MDVQERSGPRRSGVDSGASRRRRRRRRRLAPSRPRRFLLFVWPMCKIPIKTLNILKLVKKLRAKMYSVVIFLNTGNLNNLEN